MLSKEFLILYTPAYRLLVTVIIDVNESLTCVEGFLTVLTTYRQNGTQDLMNHTCKVLTFVPP